MFCFDVSTSEPPEALENGFNKLVACCCRLSVEKTLTLGDALLKIRPEKWFGRYLKSVVITCVVNSAKTNSAI